MEYTYIIPTNIKNILVATLNANGLNKLSEHLKLCDLDFQDIGLAYYAGLSGDVWDKHAIDCNISAPQSLCNIIISNKKIIANWLNKIFPSSSGLLMREISILPQVEDFHIDLPELPIENWDTLYKDIMSAVSRNEPSLVIDRLHTFAVMFIRNLCDEKGIPTKNDKGDGFALHSIMGSLAKYYINENLVDSQFSTQALKACASLFEKYNDVRNNKSYAHDNEILNNIEACYAVKIMSDTICFIHDLEQNII